MLLLLAVCCENVIVGSCEKASDAWYSAHDNVDTLLSCVSTKDLVLVRTSSKRPVTHLPISRLLVRRLSSAATVSSSASSSAALENRLFRSTESAFMQSAASRSSTSGFTDRGDGISPLKTFFMMAGSDSPFHMRSPVAASQSMTPTA